MNLITTTKFCNILDLPCESINGTIDSGDINVGHQWNAIMIDDKIYHVDISSAIHCKDGSNKENTVEDFFGTYNDLCTAKGNRNRKIYERGLAKIDIMKSKCKNLK